MTRTALIIVFAILLAAAAYALLPRGSTEASMTFDRSIWTNEEAIYQEPYPRQSMVKDLMSNHLRVGMSRADVIALLGEPTETPHFQERDLVYWLGTEKGFVSVDSSWLVIDLDDAGKVAALETVTD